MHNFRWRWISTHTRTDIHIRHPEKHWWKKILKNLGNYKRFARTSTDSHKLFLYYQTLFLVFSLFTIKVLKHCLFLLTSVVRFKIGWPEQLLNVCILIYYHHGPFTEKSVIVGKIIKYVLFSIAGSSLIFREDCIREHTQVFLSHI